MAVIELGGNIILEGFKERDYAELIVIKKIVGRYARQISDQERDFKSLKITLRHAPTPGGEGAYEIRASCATAEKKSEGEAREKNLFIALDAALKKVVHGLASEEDHRTSAG